MVMLLLVGIIPVSPWVVLMIVSHLHKVCLRKIKQTLVQNIAHFGTLWKIKCSFLFKLRWDHTYVILIIAPTEPRDIISTNVTQSSIFLTWQRPDPPNGLITNYTVSNDNQCHVLY